LEFFPYEKCTDGKTSAEPFGEGNQIALHAVVFRSEKLSGASDARLHFIEAQERAVFIAKRSQCWQEARGWGNDASFSLHWLDEDRGNVRTHRRAHGIDVSIRHVRDAFERWAETFAVLGRTRQSDRAHGSSVKGILEGDDAVTLRLVFRIEPASSELQHRFVGFGARVAEEGAIHARALTKLVGESNVLRIEEVVRHVHQSPGLRRDRVDQARMRVTQRAHGHARTKVQVPSSFSVPHFGASPALEDERGLTVVPNEAGFTELFEILSLE